jgi:hypothetical protein
VDALLEGLSPTELGQLVRGALRERHRWILARAAEAARAPASDGD